MSNTADSGCATLPLFTTRGSRCTKLIQQLSQGLSAHHGSRFWDDSSSAVSCYGKVPTSPPPAVTEMHNETQDESVGSAEKQAESVGDREPQKKVAAHQQDSNLFLN
ncbi:uncharacterized protein V6R79_003698 [Siganus canaliculatus]